MASGWKTVRVFVSSTFSDMHAERDQLIKVVFPRVREWCEQRCLHLVDVDLRWGVTQEDADNGKAIDICLKEIDRARPFFLCFLGNRYGFVPKYDSDTAATTSPGPRQHDQLSITHIEIQHAALDSLIRDASSIGDNQAFFYFRSADCLPSPDSLTELSADQRDAYEEAFFERCSAVDTIDRRLALEKLKAEIRGHYAPLERVFDYGGVWDPEAVSYEERRFPGRLVGLEALGQRVERDLKQAIAKEFANHLGQPAAHSDALTSERILHEAFAATRNETHVAREDIESRLTRYALSDEMRPLIVSGPVGSGKSATLAHWIFANTEARDGATARWAPNTQLLPFFIGASPASTDLLRLLDLLCRELRRRFDLRSGRSTPGASGVPQDSEPLPVPADPLELQHAWINFLELAGKKAPVMIVIDALDQLAMPQHQTSPISWLPRLLPHGVKLIVSVSDGRDSPPSNGSHDRPLASLRREGLASEQVGTELRLRALDIDERRRIVEETLGLFGKRLDPEHVDLMLENQATCNPLFLVTALEELRVFGSFRDISARIERLPCMTDIADMPAVLDALYGQIFERLEREEGTNIGGIVPAFFELLASARDGLTEQELSDLLAERCAQVPASARGGALQIVLRALRRHLMRTGTKQAAVISFYHQTLRSAVHARYLGSASARYRAHRELANYFERQPWWLESIDVQRARTQVLPPRPRDANLRKIVQLPEQLFALCEQTLLAESPRPLVAGDEAIPVQAVEALLTSLDFHEAVVEGGNVSDLIVYLEKANAIFPPQHPALTLFEALKDGIRRDMEFLRLRPTTIFQCLWNSCWWRDAPDAQNHYAARAAVATHPRQESKPAVCELLESWRRRKEELTPGFVWLRALRPLPSAPGGFVTRITGHMLCAQCSVFALDGGLLVSGDWTGCVRFWDPLNGASIATRQPEAGAVYTITHSVQQEWIATGHHDGFILVWDARGQREILRLSGHTGPVRSLAFSPCGKYLISGADDASCRRWSLDTCTEIARHSLEAKSVYGAFYSLDGRVYGAPNSSEDVVLWSSADDTICGRISLAEFALEKPPLTATLAPDSHSLAVACDRSIVIFDRTTSRVSGVLDGHLDKIWSLAFSPDGSLLASASEDETVRVWDWKGGVQVISYHEHQMHVWHVAFSADGRYLASASYDETVVIHRAPEAAIRLRGHDAKIVALHTSPDGRRVISGGEDGVRIWELPGGTEVAHFPEAGDVTAATFSIHGRSCAAAAMGGKVKVWSVEPLQERAELVVDPQYVCKPESAVDLLALKPWIDRLGFARGDDYIGFTLLLGEGYGAWYLDRGEPCSPYRAGQVVLEFLERDSARWQLPVQASSEETVLRHPGAVPLDHLALRERLDRGASIRDLWPAAPEETVAWFPYELSFVTSDKQGRYWSGSHGGTVYLLALEPLASGGKLPPLSSEPGFFPRR